MVICENCKARIPFTAHFLSSSLYEITCPSCELRLVADRKTMRLKTIALLAGSSAIAPVLHGIKATQGSGSAIRLCIIYMMILATALCLASLIRGKYETPQAESRKHIRHEIIGLVAYPLLMVAIFFTYLKVIDLCMAAYASHTPGTREMQLACLIFTGSLAALAVTLLFRHAIAFLYQSSATFMAAILVLIQLSPLQLTGHGSSISATMLSWFDAATLLAFMTTGAWQAHKAMTKKQAACTVT